MPKSQLFTTKNSIKEYRKLYWCANTKVLAYIITNYVVTILSDVALRDFPLFESYFAICIRGPQTF